MNILRLIKIYELKGKVHPIEATFIDLLDGIEKHPYSNGISYRKEGIDYFLYVIRNNNVLTSYPLYHIFTGKYTCSKDESNVILKYLLEKHLNLTINLLY